VLVLVVVTLLVSAALPVREFFRQRGQIAELAQSNAEARARLAALEAERARQQDPAHVMAEARRRLHFVMPGETMYVVLEPTPSPTDEADDAPWWSQLWSSVAAADRPEAPVGAPAPLRDPALLPAAPAGAVPAPSPTPPS
jgi:cell division protein FtsB